MPDNGCTESTAALGDSCAVIVISEYVDVLPCLAVTRNVYGSSGTRTCGFSTRLTLFTLPGTMLSSKKLMVGRGPVPLAG